MPKKERAVPVRKRTETMTTLRRRVDRLDAANEAVARAGTDSVALADALWNLIAECEAGKRRDASKVREDMKRIVRLLESGHDADADEHRELLRTHQQSMIDRAKYIETLRWSLFFHEAR